MSGLRRTHRARGQAVFETTIVIPLFLLAFFALLWAMKESSLSERVHLGVRYAGMIQSLADPYASFSLYTEYATIDNASPAAAQPCFNGSSLAVTVGHTSFWQPTTIAPTTAACTSGLTIINKPETYSQPILLRNNYASLGATVDVGNTILAGVLGNTATSVSASENFFRSPDIGTLLKCTPLGPAVKVSLEALSDTVTPTTASTPLPSPNVPLDASPIVDPNISATCASPTVSQFAAPILPY